MDAGALVARALAAPDLVARLSTARAVDVLAAGKAAAAMLESFTTHAPRAARRVVGVGPAGADVPAGVEWYDAGHPVPTDGSVRGARRALDLAADTRPGALLRVLLSGGGSALMALPAEGVTLADKQDTVRLLLQSGADIHELNTVRKHLSAIKGGLLAAAAQGDTHTLAVSDVVGDDLSVIASGPTTPDDSTYAQALHVLAARGGRDRYPASVVARLTAGAAGSVAETPQSGDGRLERATATVIGRQRGALDDAGRAAHDLGYRVVVVLEPVTGEARVLAAWVGVSKGEHP